MSPEKQILSRKQAEALARNYLTGKGLGDEISRRTVKVQRIREGFKVVFSPSLGVRGGDFTLIISEAGAVLSQRFEH